MDQTAHSRQSEAISTQVLACIPSLRRAATGAPPQGIWIPKEGGLESGEGGFHHGIRSWMSSLRLSLSISGGMLCCGGRSSPRRLSTGTRWADGWAGVLPRSSSTSGCARTAEGSTATGVLLMHVHAETGPEGISRSTICSCTS